MLLTAQERDRAKVPDSFKWNLADIYPDQQAWRARKDEITKELPSLRKLEGQLGASAATLAEALELMSRLDKELSRLYVYASMLSDQDTRVSEPQGMQQEMQQLYANFARPGGVHRARGAARRQREDRGVPEGGAAAQALRSSTCATSCAGPPTR